MTAYVLHADRAGYGVRAVAANLLVWRALDASPSSAAYLVAFLNAHGRDVPAADVRALLTPFGSELPALPADTPEREPVPEVDERAS